MPRRIFTYQQGLGFDGLNMLVTIGAFVLGHRHSAQHHQFLYQPAHGAIAGRNPWNSDGLEWETDSPPKPYAVVHIPLVASRHPLWDDFEEEEDPDNERVLDCGRLTPTTTWLDAVADRASPPFPEDSLAPLLMSLAMFVFFVAFVFQMVWTRSRPPDCHIPYWLLSGCGRARKRRSL